MNPANHPEHTAKPGSLLKAIPFLAVVLIVSTACQLNPSLTTNPRPRTLTIDPVDAITANLDLLGVSIEPIAAGQRLQLDFLDFRQEDAPSVHILLDNFPGSSIDLRANFTDEDRWETSLRVRPDGSLELSGALNGTSPADITVHFDHSLDIIQIDLPDRLLSPPGIFTIALAVLDPVTGMIADTTGNLPSDSPPIQALPLILSFHNTFPAATPAQALRSWDGAHNGPAGERFGLRHLLEAVEDYRIPVTLSDLRQVQSLAGLRILGAEPWIKRLEQMRMIYLPNPLPLSLCAEAPAPGWKEEIQTATHRIDASFDYPPATALACIASSRDDTNNGRTPGYQVLFRPGGKYFHNGFSPGWMTDEPLQIPDTPAAHLPAIDGGPALQLRSLLAENLAHPEPDGIVLLGIDFQASFWGDPGTASAYLGWIAARSWIQPIAVETFMRRSLTSRWNLYEPETKWPQAGWTASRPGLPLDEVMPLLEQASDGLGSVAWQVLLASHTLQPCVTPSSGIAALDGDQGGCTAYLDSLKRRLTQLAQVMAWEQKRATASQLTQPWVAGDTTAQASSAVVYADEDWLVIADPEQDLLSAVFARHTSLGSIPLVWDNWQMEPDSTAVIKLAQIIPGQGGSLEIRLQPDAYPGEIDLPLFFLPGYLLRDDVCVAMEQESQSVTLGCKGEERWRIEILGVASEFRSSLDSPARWDSPENPNEEMPAGHFLPILSGRVSIKFENEIPLIFTRIAD